MSTPELSPIVEEGPKDQTEHEQPFNFYDVIPELHRGQPTPPELERIEKIEQERTEKSDLIVGISLYALELCGRIPSEESLLERTTTLDYANSSKKEELSAELSKLDFMRQQIEMAYELCAKYNYTQLQGELKALTPQFTSENKLSTTPGIIRAVNTMHNKNMIGADARRKAEGIMRVLILCQQGRADELPEPRE